MRNLYLGVLSLVCLCAILSRSPLAAQETQDASAFSRVQSLMRSATDHYKAKDYAASASEIAAAQKAVEEHVAELSKELARIEKAHQLLVEQGQQLPAWKSLPELFQWKPAVAEASPAEPNTSEPPAGDVSQVSFTQQVAPVLAKHCGNCHIGQAKGQFSAKSFAALMKGTRKGETVVPGNPDESRLVTLVESRQMPPRSQGIPEDELQVLRDWVAQGATFDGQDENEAIEFTPAAGQRSGPAGRRGLGPNN